ncbi:MAG: GNAT family N-acetyltransferase [bacterium]
MSKICEEKLIIRRIENKDIKAFYELVNYLDLETEFRAFEPGERKQNYLMFESEMRERIKSNYIIYICEYDEQQIGYIEGAIGQYNRNKHLIHFNIALKLGYTGLKIGEKLIIALEDESKKEGISRIELTVFTYNDKAVKLYKKLGYLIEGIKFNSFKINNNCIDEFLMSKNI